VRAAVGFLSARSVVALIWKAWSISPLGLAIIGIDLYAPHAALNCATGLASRFFVLPREGLEGREAATRVGLVVFCDRCADTKYCSPMHPGGAEPPESPVFLPGGPAKKRAQKPLVPHSSFLLGNSPLFLIFVFW
jgi:hypothetical protein